jgi:hypothetical protein
MLLFVCALFVSAAKGLPIPPHWVPFSSALVQETKKERDRFGLSKVKVLEQSNVELLAMLAADRGALKKLEPQMRGYLKGTEREFRVLSKLPERVFCRKINSIEISPMALHFYFQRRFYQAVLEFEPSSIFAAQLSKAMQEFESMFACLQPFHYKTMVLNAYADFYHLSKLAIRKNPSLKPPKRIASETIEKNIEIGYIFDFWVIYGMILSSNDYKNGDLSSLGIKTSNKEVLKSIYDLDELTGWLVLYNLYRIDETKRLVSNPSAKLSPLSDGIPQREEIGKLSTEFQSLVDNMKTTGNLEPLEEFLLMHKNFIGRTLFATASQAYFENGEQKDSSIERWREALVRLAD